MRRVVYDQQIFAQQQFGGISRYFFELAARLDRRPGWHTRVVAPVHANAYLAGGGAPTFGFYTARPSTMTSRLARWSGALLTPAVVAATRADVLHHTFYKSGRRPAHARVVVTVFDMIHEVLPQHFPPDDPLPALKRRSIAAADHLICISHSGADDLVRLYGVPRHKISVTHLAHSSVFDRAALDLAPPDRPAPERPYLLYVGHRGGYKNYARLLEAYAASARLAREFDLLLFGGPPLAPDEQAQIAALGLRQSAVRHRSGDDLALARAYAGARAFVYPSEYEGFGIPPLEAMACGCAVVCSNTSSIPEVVGRAAELFDPTDSTALRDAVERVAFDDTRRDALVAAGLERSRLFSWDLCVDRTIEAYATALQARVPADRGPRDAS